MARCWQSWVLTVLVLTVLGARVTQAQVYGVGACPEYQTSENFNVERISQLVERGGVVPYLSSGTISERYQSCQYLRLQNGGVFTYTYRDSSNSQRTVTGTYTVVPSAFKQPGYLRLDMGTIGLLGSDVTGNVRLYPVLVEDDKEVFVACTNFGLFHAEYAYTFLTPGAVVSGDVGDLKRELVRKGIPLAGSMSSVDQSCFEYDIEAHRNSLQAGSKSPSSLGNDINVDRSHIRTDPVRNAHWNPFIQAEGRPVRPRNPLWYDTKA
ncbi:hypothetical protein FHG87_016756 [Trinorchestia longiramus]|nr:hypothetical protein FHG87_016756 [Trinorchestia longiramus]